MKRLLLLAILCAAPAAVSHAEMVTETWGAKKDAVTHAETLKVLRVAAGTWEIRKGQLVLQVLRDSATTVRLVFDLAALPKGAAIQHASLYCETARGAQPAEPALIFRADASGKPAGAALKLEAPWYRSFDATGVVLEWAKDPAANRGFLVANFDGLLPDRSTLEVRYSGKAGSVPAQVAGLKAVHHDGQTFLVWKEHEEFQPPPESVVYVEKFSRKGHKIVKEPGKGWHDLPCVPAITLKTLRALQGLELRDQASGFQGIKAAKQLRRVPDVRYRIYRHAERITPQNIQDAEWVGEARPLSAFDQKMAVITFKGEYIDQREVGDSIIPTSCVEDGVPVAAGEAIYAHNPANAGNFFYAVTCYVDGTENTRDLGDANSLAAPVAEKLEPQKPVLQRLQEVEYGSGVLERWYLFFAGPPYANLPGDQLHVLVGQPENVKPPFPMIIDGFHGGFNIVGALRVPSGGSFTLLIENQTDYSGDGDLLYNEGRGTLRSFKECKVDYFTERYFLRVIDWAMGQWQIDRARVFGGQHDSGPLHLAVRHPEIFKRIFLGNYTASYVYSWGPPSNGLPTILGPRGIAKTPQGDDAWSVLDLGWFLRQDPGRDIPLVMVSSGTGKDSGHTSEFGWQDDPRGMAALRDARQPFIAAWGTGGDDPGGSLGIRSVQPEVGAMFAKIRWDATIPAFANCSLDDNPGNGDPADGQSCGQINGYLIWDNNDAVDEKDAWEMTVWVVGTCPEESCTVDVTPRFCKNFKPKAGDEFKWTDTDLKAGKAVQTGTVVADRWKLVTVKDVQVHKGKNRLRIERK